VSQTYEASSVAKQQFGSDATELKLDAIEQYLTTYKVVMNGAKRKWPELRIAYIDASAGSGVRQTKRDAKSVPKQWTLEISAEDAKQLSEFRIGSALRAFSGEQSFDRYTFIEKNKSKIEELKARNADHKLSGRCIYRNKDANEELQRICKKNWKNRRAVVFLDPFGNTVAWETLEAIAATESIDVWYLFTSGNGVFRQISNNGTVTPEAAASLDRLFGTADWRSEFLKEEHIDGLFETTVEVCKSVTPESATQFMINRMRSIFKGGVLDETLPLGDPKNGYPLFSLIFAWGTPNKKAGEIAKSAAGYILKSKEKDSGWYLRD
jgi:three-Cys-motif partner protein